VAVIGHHAALLCALCVSVVQIVFSNINAAAARNISMKVLINAERIQHRIVELAAEITQDYKKLPLTIVGVLNGSLMFLADLVRHIQHPLQIGFIQVSSYRGTATEAGELHFGAEILPDLKGRHVLVLDDILDTGQTLTHLVKHFQARGVASLKLGVLLRKLGRQTVACEPDYVGFEIPDHFVVGYGLDFNDEFRHLPFIADLPADFSEPSLFDWSARGG